MTDAQLSLFSPPSTGERHIERICVGCGYLAKRRDGWGDCPARGCWNGWKVRMVDGRAK